MTNFWTNLFNHKRTYVKPQKPTKSFELVWNEAYQDYLTQLIQELETRIILHQQIKKLLQLSLYLDEALTKSYA